MDTLNTIYTTDEAAERMRLTRRGLIKVARDWGYCSRIGRNYFFSEEDLLLIWQALREPPKSSKPLAMRAPPSDYRKLQNLLKLTAKKKGPGRKRWEVTHEKNKEQREATKAELKQWEGQEPLDHSNVDPGYWTADRKRRRKVESLAKKKGWMMR